MSGGEYASFSADGKKLVFVGMSDVKVRDIKGYKTTFATMSLNVLNLKTDEVKTVLSNPKSLLDAGYIYSNPSFSPDGKFIVFQHSGSDVSGGFSVVDPKGRTIFRYPEKSSDPTPYWRPQFTSDGQKILCFSPATNENEKDLIFLIDIKNGTKKMITEGANPAFACDRNAIIFERWTNKWSSEGDVISDLWLLELSEGAEPKIILRNAISPNGQIFCSRK